jgi:hypothetical protein
MFVWRQSRERKRKQAFLNFFFQIYLVAIIYILITFDQIIEYENFEDPSIFYH